MNGSPSQLKFKSGSTLQEPFQNLSIEDFVSVDDAFSIHASRFCSVYACYVLQSTEHRTVPHESLVSGKRYILPESFYVWKWLCNPPVQL
jgi:hypothetical protein